MPNTSQELVLKISGDSREGQAAIAQIAEGLKGLSGHLDTTSEGAKAASLSVYQLRSILKEVAEGHFEEAFKNLGASIGADLEGAVKLTNVAMIGLAAGIGIVAVALLEAGKTAYEFSARAAEAGEHLRDLSLKTGISVPEISKLSYAMTVAGGSIDEVSNAMFMFERRMSTSPDVVDTGLRKIGLGLEDIAGLKPEQQFQLIAAAVAATEDPVDRAGGLFGAFGRQGRELAPVMDKLNEAMALTASISPFSDQEARDAEAFAMQVRGLRLEFDQLSISLGRDLLPAAQFFLDWLKDIKAELGTDVWLEIGPFVEQVKNLALLIAVIRGDPTNAPLIAGEQDPAALAAAAARLKAAKDAAFDAARTPDKLVAAMFGPSSVGAPSGAAFGGFVNPLEHERSIILDLTLIYDRLIAKRQEETAAAAAQAKAEKLANEILEHHIKAMVESSALASTAETAIAKSFGGQTVLHDLMMAQGLEGGAPQLAPSKIFATLGGPAVLNQFGEALSGIIAAMPDLSGAAQKRMGEILFDAPTITEQLGVGLTAALENIPAVLQAAFTGGGGGKGALKAIGTGFGAPIGQALVGLIPGSMTSLFGDTVGGALDNVLPGIGGALGSLIGPLLGKLFSIGGPSQQEVQGRDTEAKFQQQFGSFNDMLGAIAKAYEATGRSAQQARDDVNALMAAEKLGGDAAKAAIDKINGAFSEQKQDAADLDAAIKEYHFSIEELGPAMQKQKLGEQTQIIENQFRLLVGSGIDVGVVEDRMKDKISAYLQEMVKTGQQVPLEMKPMLEQMAKLGDITDASGNKVTDLNADGITFTETFSQGIDRLLKGFTDVLEKLGLIPKKIADIPTNIDISARVHYSDDRGDDVQMASSGGFVTSRGLLHFASGGIVPQWRPRGTDTIPAMLSPGEMVLTPAQQALMGGMTINVDASGSIFKDRQAMRELANVIGDHLAEHYAQVGGAIPLRRK